MKNFALARHNMVESQIRPNRVTDRRIIEAMEEIPRERFVPKRLQGVAYVDSLSADEIREYRGTLTEPGTDSPYRGRSVAGASPGR